MVKSPDSVSFGESGAVMWPGGTMEIEAQTTGGPTSVSPPPLASAASVASPSAPSLAASASEVAPVSCESLPSESAPASGSPLPSRGPLSGTFAATSGFARPPSTPPSITGPCASDDSQTQLPKAPSVQVFVPPTPLSHEHGNVAVSWQGSPGGSLSDGAWTHPPNVQARATMAGARGLKICVDRRRTTSEPLASNMNTPSLKSVGPTGASNFASSCRSDRDPQSDRRTDRVAEHIAHTSAS